MRIVRLVHQSRKLLAFGLIIGMLAFAYGCDGGGTTGESNVAPATPPPGRSGEDMKKAMEGSYGADATAKAKGEAKKGP
jgi:hypothetical protein